MKVLILSYYFPPSPTAAAQRISGWLKYLGIDTDQCTVVTRSWDEGNISLQDTLKPTRLQEVEVFTPSSNTKVISVPHLPSKRDKLILSDREGKSFMRKIYTLKDIFFEFLRPESSPKHLIYEAAKKELSNTQYDIIISSGEPFVLFKYGHELSREFEIPWIADFRDAWTNNPTASYNPVIKHFYARLEKAYSKSAGALVTIAAPYRSYLIGHRSTPTYVIENSFDPDISVKVEYPERFTITYAGTVYDDLYVDILTAGIKKVIEKGHNNVVFRFIGIDLYQNEGTTKIHQLKEKLPKNIEIYPRISQDEFLEEINKTHILLGLIPGSQSKGIMAAKTYQYLSTPHPIIMLESEKPESPSPLDPSIRYVYSANELSSEIESLFKAWNEGNNITESREARVEKHSHRARVEELKRIISITIKDHR